MMATFQRRGRPPIMVTKMITATKKKDISRHMGFSPVFRTISQPRLEGFFSFRHHLMQSIDQGTCTSGSKMEKQGIKRSKPITVFAGLFESKDKSLPSQPFRAAGRVFSSFFRLPRVNQTGIRARLLGRLLFNLAAIRVTYEGVLEPAFLGRLLFRKKTIFFA